MTENNATHYHLCIEPIDVIEAWGLNYHLGNAVKYIARAGKKIGDLPDHIKADGTLTTADGDQFQVTGVPVVSEDVQKVWSREEDLQKAMNYLYRELHGCWPWEEEEEE